MSLAADDITAHLAADAGWTALAPWDQRHKTWFRWVGQVRVEVHALYDEAGRLEAWSVWHNRRTLDPDQDSGRRARLNAFIAGGTP